MNTERHALQMSSIVVLCWNSTQTAPQCAVILRGGRVVLSPRVKFLKNSLSQTNTFLQSIIDHVACGVAEVCVLYLYIYRNYILQTFYWYKKCLRRISFLNILIFGFIYCIGTTRVAKLKLYRVRVRFLRAKKRRNEESKVCECFEKFLISLILILILKVIAHETQREQRETIKQQITQPCDILVTSFVKNIRITNPTKKNNKNKKYRNRSLIFAPYLSVLWLGAKQELHRGFGSSCSLYSVT